MLALKFLMVITCAVITLLQTACSLQKHNVSTMIGVAQIKQQDWDSIGNKFYDDKYMKGLQAWYRDSTVILESLLISRDNNTPSNSDVSVDHYIFIDLKTQSFYEYKHFSDTAKIIKQYTQADTVRVPFSWSFYGYSVTMYSDNRQDLPDTTMSNVTYKRFRATKYFKIETGDRHLSCVAYMRCDKKNSVFHLDRKFDETSLCPVTKIVYFNEVGTPFQSHEIDYIRDTLSKKELIVFKAWERNAINNPVRR